MAEQILHEVERLPADKQARVLEYVRIVAMAPVGRDGRDVIHLVGTIHADDLSVMQKVADEECERIDPHAW